MKPSKRCARCNKPIRDHDYVSVHDSFMECDEHIHNHCYKAQITDFIENEIEAGTKALAEINRRFDQR